MQEITPKKVWLERRIRELASAINKECRREEIDYYKLNMWTTDIANLVEVIRNIRDEE